MRALLLAIVCFAWPLSSSAQTSVILGAASKHLNDDTYRDPSGRVRLLNEKNPAIAIEQKIGHGGIYVVGGVYRNSIRQRSLFAGLGAESAHWRFVRVGVEAAGVTGYRASIAGHRLAVLPVAAPYVVLGPRRLGLKVYIIPSTKPILIGAIRIEP